MVRGSMYERIGLWNPTVMGPDFSQSHSTR